MELWQLVILAILDTGSMCLVITKIESEIKKDKFKIIILIFFMILLCATYNYLELPMRVIILASFVIILLSLLLNISLLTAMFDYFIAFTIISIIQILPMLAMQLLNRAEYSFENGLIISILVFVICYFIHKLVPLQKLGKIYIKRKKIINILFLMIILPITLHSIIWDANRIEGWKYIPLTFSGIIIWTLVVIIVFFEIIKITEERRVAKIYEEYNPLLENLMEELRAKQHDIKNHLQTIYGLAEKDNHAHIKSYIESLNKDLSEKNKYVITGNIIISALIYSKGNKAKAKDIPFEFNYEKPIPQYPLKEYEITEVMGNIIDNAIEAVADQIMDDDKKIIVNLRTEDEFKVIEILNTGHPISYQEYMFQLGFSTKGSKRGYGLYNVEKIVKSYKGFIEVSHSKGLTCFKLMFP